MVFSFLWGGLCYTYSCDARKRKRARVHMDLDPAVSKLESWLMAHFEATLMYITNNHFKTLLKAIWGEFMAQKLSKK